MHERSLQQPGSALLTRSGHVYKIKVRFEVGLFCYEIKNSSRIRPGPAHTNIHYPIKKKKNLNFLPESISVIDEI